MQHPLRALPGVTESMETLLREGVASLGCVAVQWDGQWYEGGPVLYRPKQDNDKVRFGKDKRVVSDCPAVLLSLERLGQPQVPLQ